MFYNYYTPKAYGITFNQQRFPDFFNANLISAVDVFFDY